MRKLFKDIALKIPCHRRTERCFTIKGKPMPICARCFSMLLGYVFIPLLFFYSIPMYVGVLCQIPMFLDGYTQLKKWRTSNNSLRFITGITSGFGFSVVIVAMVRILTNL